MMGSENHGNNNSDTSSDRETDRSLSPNSSKEGFGRSYECNYCKRGFTNAQALGGHMNIHRKDKAKAKKHNTASLTKPSKDHHLMVSSKSFNVIPNEFEAQSLGSLFGFSTHNPGYQFMPSNPSFRPLRDEHLRVNLNLGIGSSMESSNIESAKVGHEDWLETDVDLELRLGHYP